MLESAMWSAAGDDAMPSQARARGSAGNVRKVGRSGFHGSEKLRSTQA